MKIRIGYELIYDCPQPTPMILTLSVHYTRVSDIIIPDHLIADPPVPLTAYRDSFGNWCSRIVAPKGVVRLSADALVRDTGQPDVVVSSARQTPVEELPDETLLFLLGSRYCETDLLSQVAWDLFGKSPPDGGASRRSATTSTGISHLATSTRAPRRRGRLSTRGPAFAVITRTSPSPSVAA
jgi:transglutaminase-like putative cysteine protease